MHLAKTAASEIDVFVTRDRLLLNKASQIDEAVNVQVLSPTGLIVKLRELSETQPHAPDHVSGLGLSWRRLASEELLTFPFDRFLQLGERPRELETKVNSFLSDTPGTEVEVLWSNNEPIAFLGLAYGSPSTLTVSLCRVTSSVRSSSIRRFPMAEVINRAVTKGLEMLKVEDSAVPLDLLPNLSEMGFTQCPGGFVRLCFTRYMEQDKALSKIVGLVPDCADNYKDMSGLELERSCSPLISDAAQNYFLIPIRPGLRSKPRRQAPIVIRYVRRGSRRAPALEQRVLSSGVAPQNAHGSRTDSVVRERGLKRDCCRISSRRSCTRQTQGAFQEI